MVIPVNTREKNAQGNQKFMRIRTYYTTSVIP